jgi:acyl-CoA synthetase (AMP-forming)/AMP-acid ligase II
MPEPNRPSTFTGVLAIHALSRGAQPAILCPGRSALTYRALVEAIAELGTRLAEMGLGRGNRIAVALPHGPDFAITILAILEWASCVPLNPELDFASACALLEDRRVDAVVIGPDRSSPLRRAAESIGIRIVWLAPGATDVNGVPMPRGHTGLVPTRPVPACGDDEALVLHTSGTTAQPRAVALSHAQLLARAAVYGIDARDRCLCIAPLFTGSAQAHSLLAPLFVGGSVVLPMDLSPSAIVSCLAEFGPTYYSASPTVQSAIVGELERSKGRCRHSLRFVRASSSPLSPALQERLEAALDVPVIQGYGMTETGTIAQNPLPPRPRKPASVGVSLGLEIAIVDDLGAPADAGRIGQVVVRGSGSCDRYEGDDEATRSAFADGWFRTGDMGYLDEDGYLFLIGRIKDIVNRGGLKVSPAEVDAVLLRHPAVEEAATFPIPHPTLGEDVATAVVLRQSSATTVKDLRTFAFENLAPYKVPTCITVLSSLPKNPSGKISRAALADLVAEVPTAPFCAARNPVEKIVLDAFADALLPRGERPGVHDNFFQLGGDSLRGALVVSRVNAALGINMEPGALFVHPTAADLALAADLAIRSTGRRTPPPLVARPRHR